MPSKRNANGQTKSGLYCLFVPMEWNFEGYIDRYGMPVFKTPIKPIIGIDGEDIKIGAIDYWENEVNSLTQDPDALNEFYRQFPRSESHAFRDESKQSIFNLTKIYQQIDYNDSLITDHHLTRGSFSWKNGIKDTEVIYLAGNHDDMIRNFLPVFFDKFSIQEQHVHTTPRGNYLCLHGDVFDAITTHSKFIAVIGDIGYQNLLRLNRIYAKYRQWRGKKYFSLSKAIKSKVKRAVNHLSKFDGHLFKFDFNNKSSCLRCFMPVKPDIEDNCSSEGIFSPVAAILGSLQANEVLKTILELKDDINRINKISKKKNILSFGTCTCLCPSSYLNS